MLFLGIAIAAGGQNAQAVRCDPASQVALQSILTALGPDVDPRFSRLIEHRLAPFLGERIRLIDPRRVRATGTTLTIGGFAGNFFNLEVVLEPDRAHTVTWVTRSQARVVLHVPLNYVFKTADLARWLIGHPLHPGASTVPIREVADSGTDSSATDLTRQYRLMVRAGTATPVGEVRLGDPALSELLVLDPELHRFRGSSATLRRAFRQHLRFIQSANRVLVFCPSYPAAHQLKTIYSESFPDFSNSIHVFNFRESVATDATVRDQIDHGRVRILLIPARREHRRLALGFPSFDSMIDVGMDASTTDLVRLLQENAGVYFGRRSFRLYITQAQASFLRVARSLRLSASRADAADSLVLPAEDDTRAVARRLWRFVREQGAVPRSPAIGVPVEESDLQLDVQDAWRSRRLRRIELIDELTRLLSQRNEAERTRDRALLARYLGDSEMEILGDRLWNWVVSHLQTRHPAPRFSPRGIPARREEHALANRVKNVLQNPTEAAQLREAIESRLAEAEGPLQARLLPIFNRYWAGSRPRAAADELWAWVRDPANRDHPIPRTYGPASQSPERVLRRAIDWAYASPEQRREMRSRLEEHLATVEDETEIARLRTALGRYVAP